MATGNMGIKRKDMKSASPFPLSGMESDPEESKKAHDNEVVHPTMELSDKHIEAAGLSDAMPDDIVTFTVKARVTSVKKKSPTSKASYDSDRVELEVQDISDVDVKSSESPEDDAPDAVSSILGFSAKKVGKSAPMSPKSAGVKL